MKHVYVKFLINCHSYYHNTRLLIFFLLSFQRHPLLSLWKIPLLRRKNWVYSLKAKILNQKLPLFPLPMLWIEKIASPGYNEILCIQWIQWNGAPMFELGQVRKKSLNRTLVLIIEIVFSQLAIIFFPSRSRVFPALSVTVCLLQAFIKCPVVFCCLHILKVRQLTLICAGEQGDQFCRSVVFDSLRPCGLQHTRLPCPSPTPRACSSSCPLNQWCHPTISSSVVPFSSCLQSFPESGSFLMSQFFASGGQSIGASALASVLWMNIQDWFPLGFTGLISLRSKGLSSVSSNTRVQTHQFFSAQLSLWSNSHIHIWPLEKP